jgi:hypothetical protein
MSDDQTLDEIARLLAVLVRLQLGSQAEAIVELDRAGIAGPRVASLVGTTPATVRATLQKQRKC